MSAGTMQRIRELYQVPAKRGMRVTFNGKLVVITGTTRGALRLRVRAPEGGKPFPIHPTWRVEYAPLTTERTKQ